MILDSPKQKAKIRAENLQENLKNLNFSVGELSLKQNCYDFEVTKEKSKAKILVYFGKKGIKTVIQANTNSDLFNQLDAIINGKIYLKKDDLVEPEKYIGTDESGKGDFFGPLIVCAFAYEINLSEKIKTLKIKDSKQLSKDEVLEIYNVLSKEFNDRYEVVEIHPPKYNQLYQKMKNLNDILVWAHSKAIINLANRYNYENIIIDKFVSKDSFNSKLLTTKNLIFEEKAERFVGVAIASIIARARLLIWFDKKNKELDIKIPLGSSSKVTKVAQEISAIKGKNFIQDLIKLHFKNFKEING
jgi:ribonuclease HIII